MDQSQFTVGPPWLVAAGMWDIIPAARLSNLESRNPPLQTLTIPMDQSQRTDGPPWLVSQ